MYAVCILNGVANTTNWDIRLNLPVCEQSSKELQAALCQILCKPTRMTKVGSLGFTPLEVSRCMSYLFVLVCGHWSTSATLVVVLQDELIN